MSDDGDSLVSSGKNFVCHFLCKDNDFVVELNPHLGRLELVLNVCCLYVELVSHLCHFLGLVVDVTGSCLLPTSFFVLVNPGHSMAQLFL